MERVPIGVPLPRHRLDHPEYGPLPRVAEDRLVDFHLNRPEAIHAPRSCTPFMGDHYHIRWRDAHTCRKAALTLRVILGHTFGHEGRCFPT